MCSLSKGPMEIVAKLLAGWRPRSFVAIDFETANRSRSSACAVALVRVEGDRIVERVVDLIRPPTRCFEFTYIHGISWSHVKAHRAFCAVWRCLSPLLDGAEFLAAHNAKFDQGILGTCCRESRVSIPELPFLCTVKLARARWQLRPTRLPDVCDFLGLPLRHHDPMSDAEACARIVLAAMGEPSTRPWPRTIQ
jgi:DNA polymerase III subunit epsilon